jgi:hypothetical protein
MVNMKKILIMILLVLSAFIIPNSVLATTFDLVAPSSQLVRGQEVKFTVNINTESKSLSSSIIGMTYQTQYLEYVSTLPGNSFTTVSASVQDGGKLLITGSSTTPYSGTGVFAYITFKLIATGPGSTELCALYNPSSSTPTPTLTSQPIPTSLPQSGESKSAVQGVILASLFFTAAGISFFVLKIT